jgi:Skp family chaperone for outer membrane proteins
MDIWVGLGMGVIIGLLIGVLLAALALQSRLARAQRQSPEITRLQAEIARLQAEIAALNAEVARRQEETAKVRVEADEHRLARTTLANEQTLQRAQYATVQSMLSSANKEKERLLLDMLTLRGEVDQLQRELDGLKQQS